MVKKEKNLKKLYLVIFIIKLIFNFILFNLSIKADLSHEKMNLNIFANPSKKSSNPSILIKKN